MCLIPAVVFHRLARGCQYDINRGIVKLLVGGAFRDQ
jgi:hypothetical protein